MHSSTSQPKRLGKYEYPEPLPLDLCGESTFLGPFSQVIVVLKAVPKEVLERYGAPGDDSGCLATKEYPASGN